METAIKENGRDQLQSVFEKLSEILEALKDQSETLDQILENQLEDTNDFGSGFRIDTFEN